MEAAMARAGRRRSAHRAAHAIPATTHASASSAPRAACAISPQVEFPDEAFMALELAPGAAAGGGRFLYPDAFGLGC